MYRYDASYAVEVQRAHPGRFAIVKPVERRAQSASASC
jgi:L-fuconolactonase